MSSCISILIDRMVAPGSVRIGANAMAVPPVTAA